MIVRNQFYQWYRHHHDDHSVLEIKSSALCFSLVGVGVLLKGTDGGGYIPASHRVYLDLPPRSP